MALGRNGNRLPGNGRQRGCEELFAVTSTVSYNRRWRETINGGLGSLHQRQYRTIHWIRVAHTTSNCNKRQRTPTDNRRALARDDSSATFDPYNWWSVPSSGRARVMAAVYCILQSAIGHWRGVVTRCLHFKAGCIITYDILCIAMDLVVCIYICICICLYLCAVFLCCCRFFGE